MGSISPIRIFKVAEGLLTGNASEGVVVMIAGRSTIWVSVVVHPEIIAIRPIIGRSLLSRPLVLADPGIKLNIIMIYLV
jgi:hypothetical protein